MIGAKDEKIYATWKDLHYTDKAAGFLGLIMFQAKMDFDNGWGVHVAYNPEFGYEFMVLKNGRAYPKNDITASEPSGLKRVDSPYKLDKYMRDIQNLDEFGHIINPKDDKQVTSQSSGNTSMSKDTKTSDKNAYATWKDLKYIDRSDESLGGSMFQSKTNFDNGWGVSVLFDSEFGYEFAVLKDGRINTDNEVTQSPIRVKHAFELDEHLYDVQHLDEFGHIVDPDREKRELRKRIEKHVDEHRKNLAKSRRLRKAWVREHPEDKLSGAVWADKIAEMKISKNEKRTITPDVAREIINKKMNSK